LPTANRRVRQRGYDQSQLIARQLAKLTNRPATRLLNRRGQSRQVGANRQTRRRQQASAYVICKQPPPNHPILLIDDILTTGASLEAAAVVLRQAGAQTISAAVFASKSLPQS
jgi:predicted amidophosphoribosyltransferase